MIRRLHWVLLDVYTAARKYRDGADDVPKWFEPILGICANVEYLCEAEGVELHADDPELHVLFRLWPELGYESLTYPVGGAHEFHGTQVLWNNPRRWELLRWLIEATKL